MLLQNSVNILGPNFLAVIRSACRIIFGTPLLQSNLEYAQGPPTPTQ